MKKILLMAVLAFGCLGFASAPPRITPDGYCKGIRLCGKVKVVASHADFLVKVVDYAPHLDVKVVRQWPDKIGEWQFVERYSEADFTIRFVDYGADFYIRFTDCCPGVR
jgi:hypothetical protein